MESRAHKKSHLNKKHRIKTQERFAKKFPYRYRPLRPNPLPPKSKIPRTQNVLRSWSTEGISASQRPEKPFAVLHNPS
jgi:hypothetical protein